MKILWITFGLPYPPQAGSPMRDYFLLREISKSAAVDLVCIYPPGTATDTGTLPSFCRSVELIAIAHWRPVQTVFRALEALWAGRPLATVPFFFPQVARRIADLLEQTSYDLVQVESAQLLAYGLVAHGRCPAILSLHNVGYEHYASMAQLSRSRFARAVLLVKAKLLSSTERRFASAYSQAVLVSGKEEKHFRVIASRIRTAVVDNGVDCEVLRPLPPAGGAELLFVGIMDYLPNVDAALFLAREILPLIAARVPGVRLTIVGRSPAPEVRALQDLGNVEVTGFVADLIPYYRRAAAVVAPLRAGGGTRLKILEAMALARPVVTSRIGCEGLEGEPGRHLLVADSAARLADAAIQLLTDPGLGQTLAANARRLVASRYDWPILGQRLAVIHRETVARGVTR